MDLAELRDSLLEVAQVFSVMDTIIFAATFVPLPDLGGMRFSFMVQDLEEYFFAMVCKGKA